MPRDFNLFVEDALSSIDRIRSYTAGMDKEFFAEDMKTVDAVVRNLEIIGEACKKVPAAIRAQYPKVEWQKICGLRDILIHEYFGIDMDIVWDVIQTKLDVLVRDLRRILDEIQDPDREGA